MSHFFTWRVKTPRNLTASLPLKNHGWKTTFLLARPILRGYVRFPGCTLSFPSKTPWLPSESKTNVLWYRDSWKLHPWKLTWNTIVKGFGRLFSGSMLILQGVHLCHFFWWGSRVHWSYRPRWCPSFRWFLSFLLWTRHQPPFLVELTVQNLCFFFVCGYIFGNIARCWFQWFFECFSRILWGNDPIWLAPIFQKGWVKTTT